MLVVHGYYKLFRRRAAVRNAWCAVCKQPRLAVGVRSLLVIHLFWIPVLPVARVTDWFCASCDNDPRSNRTMRPSAIRWGFVAAAVLILAGLGLLANGLSKTRRDDRSDAILESAAILLVGAAVLGLAFLQRRRTQQLGFDIGQDSVEPLGGDTCPLCGDLMLTLDNPRCARCNVDIITG